MCAATDLGDEFAGLLGNVSPHGVLITDQNLVVRGWNNWLARHSRLSASAAIGHHLFTLFPELCERQLDVIYHQALAGQTVVLSHRLHRFLLPMPPGDVYAFEFDHMQQSAQVGPFTQASEIVGTVTVISDVTERVAREHELQQLLVQERQARAEVEHAVGRVQRLLNVTTALSSALTPAEIAQVIIENGGAALGASAGLIAELGAGQESLQIVYSFGYPPPTVDEWRYIPLALASPLTEAVIHGQAVFVTSREELEARYPRLASPGVAVKAHALLAIPLDVHGRVTGVLGLSFAAEQQFGAEDRAFLNTLAHQGAQALERARLYEAEHLARARAENAVKIRDQFLSIAAHELRTPLTALLGNAQLLQRRLLKEDALPERHLRLLELTIKQGLQLARMVAMMLDVSRLETGRFTLTRTRLDFDQLLRRVVEELQPASNRHTIIYNGPAQPILLDGDELRLEQMLYNLLTNAIKYSPNGGEVNVDLTQQEATVVLAIRDHGIGIPEEALPQLFQQFFRASNAESRSISGVGIGLYIVREIVTRHGGEIAVASTLDKGSTFTVRLPCLG